MVLKSKIIKEATIIQEDVVKAPEACRILGMSRPTLYKAIDSGDIPAWRDFAGSPWKFSRSDLQDLLESKKMRRF